VFPNGPGELVRSECNDADDSDTGPNDLQNKPILTSAATSSTATTVKGTLNSTPGTSFSIEFYANPSGADEGQRFIGQQSVSTDASGDATFSFQSQRKVAAGQNITATATNSSTRDTSEFSAPSSVKDAAGPRVKSVTPAENATGVSPTANVSALFSEAMNS
jgi:hypothetical protein